MSWWVRSVLQGTLLNVLVVVHAFLYSANGISNACQLEQHANYTESCSIRRDWLRGMMIIKMDNDT